MNERILMIEDERELCMTLGDRLRSDGYAVEFEYDGLAGRERARRGTFDLIIMDIMLPLRNGLDVCSDLRREGIDTPILLLTARNQTIDKVVGLKLGADDYVTKPFDSYELMARIEVLLRRSLRPAAAGAREVCHMGSVTIDLGRGRVTRDGEPVSLTAREFQLLRFFVEHRGATVTREQLLREVWGHEEGTVTRTVDVHVAGLRQKLERSSRNPELIVTVPGIGYKLQE